MYVYTTGVPSHQVWQVKLEIRWLDVAAIIECQ